MTNGHSARPSLRLFLALGVVALAVTDIALGLRLLWRSSYVSLTLLGFLTVVYGVFAGVGVGVLGFFRAVQVIRRVNGSDAPPIKSSDELVASSVRVLWRTLNRPALSLPVSIALAVVAYLLIVRAPSEPQLGITSRVLVQPATHKVYIADDSERRHGAIIVSNTIDPHSTFLIPIGSGGNEGATSTPQDMVLDPAVANPATDRPFLYVADAAQGKIHVIDVNRNVEVEDADVSVGMAPRSIAITPDGRKLFVSNEKPIPSGTVSVIDVSGLSVRNPKASHFLANIGGVGCPEGLAMAPNGRELYVATQCGGDRDPVFVIDTADDKVTGAIPDLAVGGMLAVSPDGSQLYVARANFPCVQPTGAPGSPFSVVALPAKRVVNTICLEGSVNKIASTVDGRYVLVSHGDQLSVFNAGQVATKPDGGLLNRIPLESPIAGMGAAADGSVYAWIPATPRLFVYNPSGLLGSGRSQQ